MDLARNLGGSLVLTGVLWLPAGCAVGVEDAQFGASLPEGEPDPTDESPPPPPDLGGCEPHEGPSPPDDPVPEPPPNSTCGDGIRDRGEGCDGADFGLESCEAFGFDGGDLDCTVDCKVVTSSCFGCGNGVIDPGEDCDGADFGSHTCESLGFGGGSLSCAGACSTIDTSACDPPPMCGDGVRNGTDECDGSDFGPSSCQSEGFTEGDLACNTDCSLDTSACVLICQMAGQPCSSPSDCCNTGCGAGGATCISNSVSVCCT